MNNFIWMSANAQTVLKKEFFTLLDYSLNKLHR